MAERVALFVPCLAEHFDARASEAAARLLLHLGVALDYPQAQTCCGQPFRTIGDLASAAALARRMGEVFAPYDVVVTPSASCAAMCRVHAPALVAAADAGGAAADSPAPALALAGKVVELATFLERIGFDASAAEWPGRATYHASCHGRDLGCDPYAADASPSVRLLRRVRGLELAPLPRASQCCGFGGAFATRFAPVSVALGEDKLAAVASAGATTLVADDAGCRLHLRGLPPLSSGAALELKHTAEILAEGLHLMPRPPRRATPTPATATPPAPSSSRGATRP